MTLPRHRLPMLALLLFAVVTPCAGAPASEPTLERLAWLEGTWEREGSRGPVREVWQRVGPRTLEGEAFRLGGDGREPLEQLLLAELGGDVYYIAMVPENPWPVSFRLTELDDGFARFENPDHDFPQSLVYRLENGTLKVLVAGPDDGFELLFQRID